MCSKTNCINILSNGTNSKTAFGRKTKALEVVAHVDLRGKTILMTGSTSGIGVETARAFALKGAHLVLCNRSLEMSESQRDKLYIESGRSEGIDIIQMDLSSLKSVRDAAQEFLSRNWPLHVLVLNAGLWGSNTKQTVDGHETTFGVNHLAHFYLTKLLLPKLRESAPSRLIIVSSEGHKYTGISSNLTTEEKLAKLNPPMEAVGSTTHYFTSKMCNVLMAMKIHRAENANGVNTYALHPGAISTNLFRDFGGFINCVGPILAKPFLKSVEQGAATTVYCAAFPGCANESGLYYDNCAASERSLAKDLAHDTELQDALWKRSIELIEKFEKQN